MVSFAVPNTLHSMKFLSYLKDGQDQLAILVDGLLYDTDAIHPELPGNMELFLNVWDEALEAVREAEEAIRTTLLPLFKGISPEKVQILAPVPRAASCRDAYAFRQHVAAARRNRKLGMIPEYDQFPVFYFTNHHSIQGPGDIECMPDHFQQLDFELEVSIVIGRQGRNISASVADEYIAGFMIMNDMSARVLQMEEMKLNLGPAKGKDFCTVTGPMLVTPDELESFRVAPKAGHTGNSYNLKMVCRLNGQPVSEGNMGDMDWTFAEIIERCAYGADLYPGDIIGSGTVGTGCLLELNGTKKGNDPEAPEIWLQPGDQLDMEIEGLGRLENTLKAADTEYSLLALKKIVAEGK
ncbi:MAG TPA: fumarylacetoacetate hydrolase family protein [Chitinophagaceae bacterium]|nr:fumarylacetoacetate hydrolase family protein [Chitinophagaceae bacterium]